MLFSVLYDILSSEKNGEQALVHSKLPDEEACLIKSEIISVYTGLLAMHMHTYIAVFTYNKWDTIPYFLKTKSQYEQFSVFQMKIWPRLCFLNSHFVGQIKKLKFFDHINFAYTFLLAYSPVTKGAAPFHLSLDI